MGALLLTTSLVFAVIANVAVKLSRGFQKKLPSAAAYLFFLGCIYFLTLSIQYMDISIAYAIWSGAMVAATATIGSLYFHEPLTRKKLVSLVLIAAGVLMLHLQS
ncbi:hypothetical protein CHL76_16330 [Marinococcus halophilus]|uniref:Putative membrane protein YvaE n=1 Tax=Marinococcus halophilus TaxID=1371 RepID=A0A510YD56_MARHA|nr:multidrug efflux SMR transporter [Marinococcus halophilus]OZT78741.1 hypothetical protein CHL76_16330 [Marinococcus halophilus]GEK60287.1 putative membrane protein YvaE [Marinococcus halophilus]